MPVWLAAGVMRDTLLPQPSGFLALSRPKGAGLGVVPGRVTRLHAKHLPQICWNAIEDTADPMFAATGLVTAYYANSFACRPLDADAVTAWSTHEGDRFAAAVRLSDCLGVQFHPEKSSRPGLRFLDHFLENL